MSVFFHTLICWFFIALILVSIFGGKLKSLILPLFEKGGRTRP